MIKKTIALNSANYISSFILKNGVKNRWGSKCCMQSTIQKENTSLIAIITCKKWLHSTSARWEKRSRQGEKSLQNTFEIKCNTFTLVRGASFAEKGAGTFDRRPPLGWVVDEQKPPLFSGKGARRHSRNLAGRRLYGKIVERRRQSQATSRNYVLSSKWTCAVAFFNVSSLRKS